MADIRRDENKREKWLVTNHTKFNMAVGDLLLLPVIKPGKTVDVLQFYSREKISHSINLVSLLKSGKFSLNKKKIYTNEFPGVVPIVDIDEALTPAEENEILKESEANDIYLKLDGSNANQNIGINDFGLQEVGFIDFDLEAEADPQEGRLRWNSDDGTLEIGMPGGVVVLQLGQEMLLRASNKTGSDITNGQVVYINGAQGSRPTITLAKADTSISSDTTIGITTEDIQNNNNGFINVFGLVRDVNTNPATYAVGDMLYLSPNTAGGYTNVKPISPEHTINIGFVLKASITEGIIFIHIINGHKLEDLYNVSVNNIVNNDIIQWNNSLNIWENKNQLDLGENSEASIFFDGTDLNISLNDPSQTGDINLTDNVNIYGVLKTLSGKIINRTSVTTSPYNVSELDHHLSVTTSSIAITLNLPIIVDGTIYHIKDQDEQSSARNITVTPNGSNTIENASNLTIKVNGASITIVGNSATNNWEIQ